MLTGNVQVCLVDWNNLKACFYPFPTIATPTLLFISLKHFMACTKRLLHYIATVLRFTNCIDPQDLLSNYYITWEPWRYCRLSRVQQRLSCPQWTAFHFEKSTCTTKYTAAQAKYWEQVCQSLAALAALAVAQSVALFGTCQDCYCTTTCKSSVYNCT